MPGLSGCYFLSTVWYFIVIPGPTSGSLVIVMIALFKHVLWAAHALKMLTTGKMGVPGVSTWGVSVFMLGVDLNPCS